jgi:peptide/nickel transport system ATP-binding protein
MAVLLITHDLGVVAQWADRATVMYAGRIVEEAPVRSFFRHPRHPYTRGLLAASVNASGSDADSEEAGGGGHYTTRRLNEIPGTVASAAGEPGCPFAPRCPDVIRACRAAAPALEPMPDGSAVACIIAARPEPARPEVEVPHVAAVG